MASRNGGRGPSASTAAMFKAEAEGRTITIGNSLVHDAGQSLGPGGRRLRAVDSGVDRLFGDDEEEEGGSKRRAKELGGEGDMDEQIYEEDFADDDEHAAMEEDDEEAKEAEVRHIYRSRTLLMMTLSRNVSNESTEQQINSAMQVLMRMKMMTLRA